MYRRIYCMQSNHYLSTTLIIFLSLALAGCNLFSTTGDSEPEIVERRELPRQLTAGELQVINRSGEFGFDLMHKLMDAGPDRNHLISPLSIQMAFGLAMNGADGETYDQMQEVFGLEGMEREQINEAASDLIELLAEFDNDVRFDIANSVWHRDDFDVEDEFIATTGNYYNGDILGVDFNDDETVARINQWVADHTEGRIDEIVEGPIDPLTMLLLINVIYFDGNWSQPFDPDMTRTRPFYVPDGSETEVDMMNLENAEDMLYAAGQDYQAVNLYYGDAGYAMTLVLPDEGIVLSDFLQEMTWSSWQQLINSYQRVTLSLEMPRFDLEYEADGFSGIMQEMGIIDAFDPGLSDFSRINPDHDDLHISDARHKTFITVDEEGTQAGAVTSIEVGIISMPGSAEIRFDRPFFYAIREAESGTILFMGTMNDPSS